ncbi:hypothetical protein [Gracilibacillus boraciitolerans]|uniref:hypothetical protein n=1 Tax=Gracilibacillus boraciitolerans TaxID=307521 RepID=UPI0004BA8B66|nr:hypothetical protein [Gracilibacillus boraciitolerans]
MLDSTTYQLYFSADGTPSDSGTVVENGTLFPILENDTNVVVFSDLIEGHYQLKVNQRPMYQDEEGTQQFVWSEILTVACEDEEQPNEELEENETLTDSADIPEDIEEKIIEKKSPEEELKEIQNEEKRHKRA